MERHAIITGGAGFIGSHLVDRLLGEGTWKVTVIDNFDPFYPRVVKEANLAGHQGDPAFTLVEGDIRDDDTLDRAFAGAGAGTTVIHLAAKVGVRPSIREPLEYHQVNATGTLKLLERARAHRVAHFVLASSSSVYGINPEVPWKETIGDLHPISPYAATKLAAEQFVQVYARLHALDTTVLRFFTVFGPRQRPDLAIHSFFRKVKEGLPIQQFGDGTTRRDYTFVGDIIDGVRAALDRTMERVPGHGSFEIFNLGNSRTVPLRDLIVAIEREAGCKAAVEKLPEQSGDVPQTYADVGKAKRLLDFNPHTDLKEGLRLFAEWYGAMH